MNATPPTIYHLYGDDRLAMEEFLDSLKEKLGPDTNAALSVQVFSGSQLDLAKFEESCLSIPFLTPRRIVLLDDMQALPKDKQWVNRFSGLMESLPPTTALVLFEIREQPRSNRKPSIHPIAKWIAENKQISYTRECSIPKGAGFADWIRERSGQLGGEISSDAARLLADWVIDDPHQADQELRKLIAYADGARMIDVEDVQQLTPYKAQSNIFGLVDAIGERKGQLAQRLLTNLLEDEEPGYAFAMVVRQFRLLLIAREAIDKNVPVTSVLNLPAFVLQKIETQARAFDDHELKQMYARLLEIDLGSKSGTIDLDVGLETIIANVAATT